MAFKQKKCEHIEALGPILKPSEYQCTECVKTGGTWVHLRTCQECGVTLCCDSSPNKHATKHYEATSHPVMASAEPKERWLWCYAHKEIAKY